MLIRDGSGRCPHCRLVRLLARGEDHADSDIDLLVDLDRGVGLAGLVFDAVRVRVIDRANYAVGRGVLDPEVLREIREPWIQVAIDDDYAEPVEGLPQGVQNTARRPHSVNLDTSELLNGPTTRVAR